MIKVPAEDTPTIQPAVPETLFHIPTRFESILAREDMSAAPLILPVEADLRQFERLRRASLTQSSGILSFVVGETGCGKTTAVYSAATHMNETFAPVLLVPHDIPLREVGSWVTSNVSTKETRAQLLLFDGREVTDDEIGIRQFIATLNAFVRTRPGVLIVWPTTDEAWHQELRKLAERVGGATLSPPSADIRVQGPEPDKWLTVLERILVQLDQGLADLALDDSTLLDIVKKATTIGAFLRLVGSAIVDRIDQVRLAKTLPTVTFVITSTSEVVGEANRIRRARDQVLKADELLGYSPRSRAGLWWKARNAEPSQTLGYVISLFQAKLATMTPSSVVYACAHFGDSELRNAATTTGIAANWSNADRTLKNTDFYRLAAGLPLTEFTSTRKGKTAQTTLDAYSNIQALSITSHKAINQAICHLVNRNVADFRGDLASFEVKRPSGQLVTDAIVPIGDTDAYLEFHHIAHPGAAAIAAYVMLKLQYYATEFNITPR